MKKFIYLDNNATTKVDEKVVDAIKNELLSDPHNPSSSHTYGQKAKHLLNQARATIASYFEVKSHEVYCTSGGTEAINMAIKGILSLKKEKHIITTKIEHAAIYNTLEELSNKGYNLSYLPVSIDGTFAINDLISTISDDTAMIVISSANSETGVKSDIEKIAKIAYEKNISLVVDGVASLGKDECKYINGISALCYSSHKIHGPKGIGIAIIPSYIKFTPLITGGQQEFNKRGGTENLHGIIGFAKAIEQIKQPLLQKYMSHMQKLRDHFENLLLSHLPSITINGSGNRICNTSNISFEGVSGESLLINLDMQGIMASHGSACTAGAMEVSRVLVNMGVSIKSASSSVRFSLCRNTTMEEIIVAADIIIKTVIKMRNII
jgi:cysteine desulfurase